MATIDEIKQQAEAVKNATQVGENTATRVGGALAGLADIAKQQGVALGKKADKETMDVELGKKADKETVNTELGKKADKETMDVELGKKADKETVNTELGKKADKETVNTELGKKANAEDVEQSFSEQKENLSKLNDSIGDVTKLKTSNKILVNAINELSQKCGISAVAIELLGSILEKAVFVDDEKDNIAALVEELAKDGRGGVVVKKPTITQDASTRKVTIVSEGNSIYYTTNGDAPTKTSIRYTGPLYPDEDCTIKAVAIDAAGNRSVVVSLAVKTTVIITFADKNLAKVAIARTNEDVEVTLPDGTTTTVKGFNWDTDGDGFVHKSEAAQKTNFNFNSNKWITSFNEAKFFKKWNISQYTLYNVLNLESINLPPVKNIGENNYSFNACKKLKVIIVNEGTERLENIFSCGAITDLYLPSTLTYFGGITTSNGALKDTTLVVPKNVTNFPSFYNTESISRIKHLNPNLNTIDMTSFSFAGSRRHVWLAATTPPTLTGTAQNGGIGTVYVPDALVDTYKAAEGWSTITVKGHSEWVD